MDNQPVLETTSQTSLIDDCDDHFAFDCDNRTDCDDHFVYGHDDHTECDDQLIVLTMTIMIMLGVMDLGNDRFLPHKCPNGKNLCTWQIIAPIWENPDK